MITATAFPAFSPLVKRSSALPSMVQYTAQPKFGENDPYGNGWYNINPNDSRGFKREGKKRNPWGPLLLATTIGLVAAANADTITSLAREANAKLKTFTEAFSNMPSQAELELVKRRINETLK